MLVVMLMIKKIKGLEGNLHDLQVCIYFETSESFNLICSPIGPCTNNISAQNHKIKKYGV